MNSNPQKKTKIENEEIIEEGKAKLILKDSSFYNSSQELNRSLTILVLQAFIDSNSKEIIKKHRNVRKDGQKDITDNSIDNHGIDGQIKIYEAMAASGIRTIRFVKELNLPKEISINCNSNSVSSSPEISNSPKNSKSNTKLIKLNYNFTVNDFSNKSIENVKSNLEINEIKSLKDETFIDSKSPHYSITVTNKDCIDQMLDPLNNSKFTVIDIDPYGSPSEFIYPALRAIKPNGLLCITATDLVTLCKKQPELVYRRYNAIPNYGPSSHEVALRIVLGDLSKTAAKMKKAIEPLLCCFCGFYLKLFVVVRESKQKSLENWENLGFLYECRSCLNQIITKIGNKGKCKSLSNVVKVEEKVIKGDEQKKENEIEFKEFKKTILREMCFDEGIKGNEKKNKRVCNTCGGKMTKSGPLWIKDYMNKEFLRNILLRREDFSLLFKKYFINPSFEEVLSFVKSLENEIGNPFFFSLKRISKILKLSSPPLMELNGALEKKGFLFSRCHFDPNCFKTDAKIVVIWVSLLSWIERERIKERCSEKAFKKNKKIIENLINYTSKENEKLKRLGDFDFKYEFKYFDNIENFKYFLK